MAPRRRGVENLQSAALTEFLTADPATHDALREAVSVTVDALTQLARRARAAHAADDRAARGDGARAGPVPARGSAAGPRARGPARACSTAACASATRGPSRTCTPRPLIAAAAGELAVGLTNQSMDAFDASPAATFVEDHLVSWLAREHGLGEQGSGVMTMGGTASNLLGLLLARDRAGANVRRDGLPPQRLADRRLRGQPRQHPPLGGAARASAPRP